MRFALVAVLLTACRFDPSGLGWGATDAAGAFADGGDADVGLVPDARPGAPDGAPRIDAATAPDAALPPDADNPPDPTCPDECSHCESDGTCVIDCGDGECSHDVVCPGGRPCEVNCIGDQACETGIVDCTEATSCAITCIGQDACDSGVACAGETCTVLCDGGAACEDELVTCEADQCEITCSGSSACAAGVCCSGETCSSCSAAHGGNCDCP